MANKFHLDIYTPVGKYFSGDVEYLEVRNSDSVLGIMAGHIPLISTLITYPIKIRFKGRTRVYASTGGLLRIDNKHDVTLMLNTIERGDEIDLDRARRAKERAEKRIEENLGDQERAKAAVERAENRIKAAEEDKK